MNRHMNIFSRAQIALKKVSKKDLGWSCVVCFLDETASVSIRSALRISTVFSITIITVLLE